MTGALPLIGTFLAGAVTVHEAVFAVRHLTCKPDHCSCPLTHKLLAGTPLHGQTVTDATYWRRANSDLTRAKTTGPFMKLPGWKRRLYRTGPVLAAAALMINLALAAAAMAVLAVALASARVLRRTGRGNRLRGWVLNRLRRLRHRDRVQTMGMLLASITGTSASTAEAGVTWNPDYAATKPGDEVARWVLPRGFKATGKEKAQAEEVWQSRVGFELVFSWQLADDEPAVVMRRARELPEKVYLHEVLDRVAALGDDKTAIGLDEQGNLICWDWKLENPHGMVVAGSRHGKTELNRSMTAQVVRKGGRVGGVDCKRISFQGLEGVPGFELRNNPRDIRGMWKLIGEFYDEMERRSLERQVNPTAEFPRWLLIIEEVNQFSAMTDDWWEELDAEDPADEGTLFWKPKRGKKTPRVWRFIKSLCWEGAEFGMHVIVDGQDGEFQALKGVRNVLGMRLLGGFQANQWKNCVGTTPVPEAPPQKGRFCLVSGGLTWVQALLGHDDKNESAAIWRDFARAGRRMDGSVPVTGTSNGPWAVSGNGTVYTPDNGRLAAGSTLTQAAPATDVNTPMSLLEISKAFLLPRASYEEQKNLAQALRQDRYRSDKGELRTGLVFPEPAQVADDGRQTELFVPSQVIDFNAARRGGR